MNEIKAGDLVSLKNLDHARVLEVNDGICQVLCYGEKIQVTVHEVTKVR